MPLYWTNIDTRNAVLSASVPVSAAIAGTLYAAKDRNVVNFLKNHYAQPMAPSCQYLYLTANVAAAAPFGYASYLVYKIGGGFDYTDTTVALCLYGTTVAAGLFAVPTLKYGKVKSVALHSVALAGLAAATSIAFYKIDHISGYWTIPFSLLAVYYAVVSSAAAGGCCSKKTTTPPPRP